MELFTALQLAALRMFIGLVRLKKQTLRRCA